MCHCNLKCEIKPKKVEDIYFYALILLLLSKFWNRTLSIMHIVYEKKKSDLTLKQQAWELQIDMQICYFWPILLIKHLKFHCQHLKLKISHNNLDFLLSWKLRSSDNTGPELPHHTVTWEGPQLLPYSGHFFFFQFTTKLPTPWCITSVLLICVHYLDPWRHEFMTYFLQLTLI